MTQSSPELDVVAAFRRQLEDLPEPPYRTRRVSAAAALAVAAAVPLFVVFGGSGAPPAALAITREATSLELRINDASADPEQMTRELNDAGIRGQVLSVPVTRQRVGSWVVIAEIAGTPLTCLPASTPAPSETVRLGDIGRGETVLRIPLARVRESTGRFVLVAGREARAGERALELDSPAVIHRDVIAPVLGPRPDSLRPC